MLVIWNDVAFRQDLSERPPRRELNVVYCSVTTTRPVTIFQGVTRAVYQIDPARWRRQQQPAGSRRVAFEAARLREGEVFEAFMGMDGKGTRVPPTRPTGRAVFGTGGSIAYWPD